MDKDQAHVGVVRDPLGDTYLSCHQCHPNDYQQRAEKFAVVLGVTPQSHEPITTTVAMNPASGAPAVRLPITPTSNAVVAGAWGWLALIAVVAVLLISLAVASRRLSRQ